MVIICLLVLVEIFCTYSLTSQCNDRFITSMWAVRVHNSTTRKYCMVPLSITYSENQNKQTMDEGTGLPIGMCLFASVEDPVAGRGHRNMDPSFPRIRYSCMEFTLLLPATKLGQDNIFTGVCDSVHRGGLPQCMLGYHPLRDQAPPPPPRAEHIGRYGQRAGGMHPTGMQSCSEIVSAKSSYKEFRSLRQTGRKIPSWLKNKRKDTLLYFQVLCFCIWVYCFHLVNVLVSLTALFLQRSSSDK